MSAYLKNFQDRELIFDEGETRAILCFFFPNDKAAIDNAIINNDIRNFAQGILVEAVDASCKMGFVKAAFDSVCRFKGPVDFMKTFARKALQNWFEYATLQDLMHAKIYETVRLGLNRNFHTELNLKLQGLAKVKGRSTYAALKPQSYAKSSHEILWV